MAVTWGRITASIYAINGTDIKFNTAITGRTNNFPNVGVLMYDAPPNTLANWITMLAIIEVLPTGLNQPSKKYSTNATVATLLSNGS